MIPHRVEPRGLGSCKIFPHDAATTTNGTSGHLLELAGGGQEGDRGIK